ncbi:hypothetical protein OROGR_007607 [Orobanche gracilis]
MCLLLDPVLASGNSAAPEGIHTVCKKFLRLRIATLEIDMKLNKDIHGIPGMGEFGYRYFGTANSKHPQKYRR